MVTIKKSKNFISEKINYKFLLLIIAFLFIAMNSTAQVKKPPVKKHTVKKTKVKEKETLGKGTFKDIRDGKIYKTIIIGKQTWMAQNLAYKETDGCWIYNNDENNIKKYGYLYDWKTAKTACPKGWHLPSDAEWTTLTDYLGGIYAAGGKMKKVDKSIWKSPNTGATNSSGFTALPGGYRNAMEQFYDAGSIGYWWSSTDGNPLTTSWVRYVGFDFSSVNRDCRDKINGYSVRCIKDK